MDARRLSVLFFIGAALLSTGAGYRTENFIVNCSDDAFARQVAVAAEEFRRDLAIEWLGQELPPWQNKCPIRVEFAKFASGETSFRFMPTRGGRGIPFDWNMIVSGSPERILDAVLPHEVTHTIFATHFGQPLPRWADEGACTSVEHQSERQKHRKMLVDFLTNDRGIPFNRMFRMMQYPRDHVGMLALYSQGHSVADFLIQHQGRRHFVDFIDAGLVSNDWDGAVKRFYEYDDLSDLQLTWNDWVRYGSKAINTTLEVDQMNRYVNLDRSQMPNGQFVSTGDVAANPVSVSGNSFASTQIDQALADRAYGQPDRMQSQPNRLPPAARADWQNQGTNPEIASLGSAPPQQLGSGLNARNEGMLQGGSSAGTSDAIVAESWYFAMMRKHEQGGLDSVTYRPMHGFYLKGETEPVGSRSGHSTLPLAPIRPERNDTLNLTAAQGSTAESTGDRSRTSIPARQPITTSTQTQRIFR